MPFTPKPRARLRIAGELAPIIGLSRGHVARRLKAMGDDREAVIAHYRAHGKKPWCGHPRPAAFNGRSYRSHTALAAELAVTLGTGHSVRAIRHKLEALPALCAGLSRILWWKNITLLTADFLAIACLAAAAILLFVGRL
jgi:hypothetical protein